MAYSIWSHALLLEQPTTTCCFVMEHEWNKIHDANANAKRIFAKISLNGLSIICALGHPVRNTLIDAQSINHPALFIPVWAVRTLKSNGVGDIANIEWCSEEYFPEATRIIVRPQDYSFYESDIKKELEEALTEYGVLQMGTTIPIKIKALKNSEYQFDIITLEPASIVLMQGDEIAIEFEKSFNEPVAQTAPVKVEVDFDAPIIPAKESIVDGGYVLGETSQPRLPDGRRWYHWMNTGLRPKDTL